MGGRGERTRGTIGAAPLAVGLALALLAWLSPGQARAADPAGPAERCMEVTRTFMGSWAALQTAGFFLRGGTGEVETSPTSPRCRGAAGDVNACWHAGRAWPSGAVVVRENPAGVRAAAICVLGIWQ